MPAWSGNRVDLRLGDAWVMLRVVAKIQREGQCPGDACDPKHDEGTAPGQGNHQPCDQWRRDRVAEAGESVGQALGEPAPGSRRPARHRAGRGREGRAFTETQHQSRRHQRDESHRQAAAHCGSGPDQSANEKRAARPEAIPHPSAHHLEHQIGIGEGGEHEAYLRVGQSELLLEHGSRRAYVHPVHVGDEVHQAQQPEDGPGGGRSRYSHVLSSVERRK